MNTTPAKKYKYLDHEPEMICLIGSSRFKELHFKVMREETLKGNIVLPMGMFGDDEVLDMEGPVKKMLDELHLVKIDKSSIVVVCNQLVSWCEICQEHRIKAMGCSGEHTWLGHMKSYIGESTKRELDYATVQKKVIRFINDPDKVFNAFDTKGTETSRSQSQEPSPCNIPATLPKEDWIGQYPDK